MGGDSLGTTFQKVVGDDSRCVAAGAVDSWDDGGGLTDSMTFMNLMMKIGLPTSEVLIK